MAYSSWPFFVTLAQAFMLIMFDYAHRTIRLLVVILADY
ncbi:hypothetical protein A1OE_584 [Candidatus Endolissoclinum faulkneri L2]|uniref:Uncharacterized protein n=1 Tax=Candidatus Endolissoclinum faulkneri L2 TaxID=1193729 RepID=K7YGR8_9PROT|nr:hypothetical protein A1OE_584 [Candidatus Endolissoclinum faulkneri L2]